MKIDALTPQPAALQELGSRLARARKQRGLTQTALAAEAGIGVATLRRIEDGQDAQLGNWFKVLKALGMTDAIDNLVPAGLVSPMAEVRRRGRRRRPGEGPAGPVRWGDEVR